jgi:GntR family transcriptional regulator/MocR family aminotransferase
MLTRGDYDRHLRSARRHYRQRRDALLHHIRRTLPDLRITGAEAGLHLIAQLPADIDPQTLSIAAHQKRVGITTIDSYQLRPNDTDPAIVLGYANLPDAAAGPAIRLLATAIAECRSSRPRPAGSGRARQRRDRLR